MSYVIASAEGAWQSQLIFKYKTSWRVEMTSLG